MKYYFDTEFLEGPQKKRFMGVATGWTPPTIDLISIGIVSEDGREYYAISKDFNLKEAWNRWEHKEYPHPFKRGETYKTKEYWIRNNVLLPIYRDFVSGDMRNRIPFTYAGMKQVLKRFGKSNDQIADDIKLFCREGVKGIDSKAQNNVWDGGQLIVSGKPEFYAYYADYDWVVFCWLFGNMINLPKGFPKYCKDLKQIMDERAEGLPKYPVQLNEHNALADAKWNKELHELLLKL